MIFVIVACLMIFLLVLYCTLLKRAENTEFRLSSKVEKLRASINAKELYFQRVEKYLSRSGEKDPTYLLRGTNFTDVKEALSCTVNEIAELKLMVIKYSKKIRRCDKIISILSPAYDLFRIASVFLIVISAVIIGTNAIILGCDARDIRNKEVREYIIKNNVVDEIHERNILILRHKGHSNLVFFHLNFTEDDLFPVVDTNYNYQSENYKE